MGASLHLTVVYGTRPEEIKLAPLVIGLGEAASVEVRVINVGQHRPHLMRVPPELKMPVDLGFDITGDGQPLSGTMAKALRSVSGVLIGSGTDAVIVQGDTSSALAGALGAFYASLPVIHLEAGLRTHDLRAPFPEEGHRRLIAGITALHLAPTSGARSNLLAEGVSPEAVVVTGNTSIDAARIAIGAWDAASSQIPAELLGFSREIVTFTAHRRENWSRMGQISDTLAGLVKRHPEIAFVVPYHPNKAIEQALVSRLGGLANAYLLGPLAYADMIKLLSGTRLLITDSGGLQEEAAYLGVPTIVIRDITERPEGIESGVAVLAGTDPRRLESIASTLIGSTDKCRRMARPSFCYGDGHAAERAVQAIRQFFGRSVRIQPGEGDLVFVERRRADARQFAEDVRRLPQGRDRVNPVAGFST